MAQGTGGGSDDFLGILKKGAKDFWESTDPKQRPDTTGDLSKFISFVKRHGLARNAKFLATFSTPRCLQEIPERKEALAGKNYGEMLAMLCHNVTMPGLQYDTTRINTFGHFEVPYDKIYSALNASFYLDAGMELKLFFDHWMDSIQLHSTKGFEFYDNFVATVDLFILNEEDKKVYHVKFYEVYPKFMDVIQLDYSQPGIATLRMDFMYKSWVSQTLAVDKEQYEGFLDKLDKYFNQYQFYKDAKPILKGIGDVVVTADEYLTRGEIIKGKLKGVETVTKGIPGIFKSKVSRIKDLGKWL